MCMFFKGPIMTYKEVAIGGIKMPYQYELYPNGELVCIMQEIKTESEYTSLNFFINRIFSSILQPISVSKPEKEYEYNPRVMDGDETKSVTEEGKIFATPNNSVNLFLNSLFQTNTIKWRVHLNDEEVQEAIQMLEKIRQCGSKMRPDYTVNTTIICYEGEKLAYEMKSPCCSQVTSLSVWLYTHDFVRLQ